MARRALIEVSQSRIELAVVNGRTVSSMCIDRPEESIGDAADGGWIETVKSWVAENGLSGASALIITRSAHGAAIVHRCPASLGRAGRVDAASLAVEESFDADGETITRSVEQLYTDRSAEDTVRNSHSLAVGEPDAWIEAVVEATEATGLRFDGVLSTDAALIAQAVDALSDESGTQLIMNLGEHGAAIACATDGRLRFVRLIRTGLEQLANAMTRVQGDDGAGLSSEEARDALFEVGIPDRDDPIGTDGKIRGLHLLPLLQPVLQRCIVDVKQSLRFGLSPAERADAKLRLCGYGAVVPRMQALIAESCGIAASEQGAGAYANGTRPASADCGPIRAALDHEKVLRSVRLAARSVVARRFSRRLERAIAIGAAIALALVGGEALLVRSELQTERSNLASLTRAGESDSGGAIAERIPPLVEAVHDARDRISDSIMPSPRWASALELIAAESGERIFLDRIEMSVNAGESMVRLFGHASFDPEEGSASEMRAFIGRLESTPLVRSIALGSTERVEIGESMLLRFELTALLRPLSSSYHIRRAAIAAGLIEDAS